MANISSATPVDCGNGMGVCQEVMLLWTVGLNGMCHPDAFGGLVGEGGYTGIWMEVCEIQGSKSVFSFSCARLPSVHKATFGYDMQSRPPSGKMVYLSIHQKHDILPSFYHPASINSRF